MLYVVLKTESWFYKVLKKKNPVTPVSYFSKITKFYFSISGKNILKISILIQFSQKNSSVIKIQPFYHSPFPHKKKKKRQEILTDNYIIFICELNLNGKICTLWEAGRSYNLKWNLICILSNLVIFVISLMCQLPHFTMNSSENYEYVSN